MEICVLCRVLLYTSVISDGDSRAFAMLCDNESYGDAQILNHECVGCVQMCVGHHLYDVNQWRI